MLKFTYAAMKADNTYVKGELTCRNRRAAIAQLERQGLLIINLSRESKLLWERLASYNKYFSDYFIHLIKVGEQSGTLDEVLKHLLEQQEREYELISNIRGAMIYPIIVIFAAIVAVIFMMSFATIRYIVTLKTEVIKFIISKIIIRLDSFKLWFWSFNSFL